MEEKIEETEKENLIIGGDFNARTREEGGPIWDETEEGRRRSKDSIINKEDRELLTRLEGMGDSEWKHRGRRRLMDICRREWSVCNRLCYNK